MLFFVAFTISVIGISDMYSLMKYIDREYDQQQIEQSNRNNGIKCHIIHNNNEDISNNKEEFGSIDIPIESNTHKKYHMMRFKPTTYKDIERENEEAFRAIEKEINERLLKEEDDLFDTSDGIIHLPT